MFGERRYICICKYLEPEMVVNGKHVIIENKIGEVGETFNWYGI